MIDKLLNEINEDKHQNPTTTSNKFKKDLWDFCKETFSNDLITTCVEYGTHKGQTTRILSHLFDFVHTCNLPNHFEEAQRLNQDQVNINYIGLDLYNSDITEPLCNDNINLFFIDAVHTHEAVLCDFTRSTYMNCAEHCYFVFDDYGLYPEVKRAVEDLVWVGKLEIIQGIGHEEGYDFGQGRKLLDYEGMICKLIK